MAEQIPIRYGKYIKNGIEQKVAFITPEKAVVDEDGVTLDVKLKNLPTNSGGGDGYLYVDKGADDDEIEAEEPQLDAITLNGYSADDFVKKSVSKTIQFVPENVNNNWQERCIAAINDTVAVLTFTVSLTSAVTSSSYCVLVSDLSSLLGRTLASAASFNLGRTTAGLIFSATQFGNEIRLERVTADIPNGSVLLGEITIPLVPTT